MKRWIAVMLLPFILIGCTQKNPSMDKLYAFRESLLKSNEITFDAEITVDYGQEYYTFCVSCTGNHKGDLSFRVLQPETISNIQGSVTGERGYLTFDNHVLAFKNLSEDRLAPVTAPWVFLTSLCGGYITSCGKTDDGYIALIKDTYEEDPLTLEVIFCDGIPISAEIFWNQARVITMNIRNFSLV